MTKLESIQKDIYRFENYKLEDSITDRLNKTLINYINNLEKSVERTEIKAKENISYVARSVTKCELT